MSAESVTARPLEGRVISITGRLASMTRSQAVALIESLGGAYLAVPREETSLLVVGDAGWPLQRNGHVTHALSRAERLRRSGHGVTVITETEFLASLGRDEGVLQRLYTLQQLARILGVPSSKLHGWVRGGLIRPAKVVRRLAYFDFRQVAGAKAIAELVASGTSPARIQRSLVSLGSWLPDAPDFVLGMAIEREGEELIFRLPGGRVADESGQLHLAFESECPPLIASTTELTVKSASEWFDEALRCQESGELEASLEAYHQSMLSGGVRADAAFNMGNVLYALERPAEALQRFMQAVEIDPEYVESWNNLGNALSDVGRHEGAVRAYQQSLGLDPGYADSHYNLAESLHQLGDVAGARRHWTSYLEMDPGSAWAEHVRERLASLPPTSAAHLAGESTTTQPSSGPTLRRLDPPTP